MKKSNFSLWLSRLAWGILCLDVLLIFAVPTDMSNTLLLTIAYVGWLILSLITASTWLIVRYRCFFSCWLGWSIPIIVLVFSNMLSLGILRVRQSNLSLFFLLLTVVSGWSIGVATVVFLWHKDKGLRLMGWGSVMIIWVFLFAWRFQGNLFELWIFSLNNPNAVVPLWWVNPMMCVFGWIFPLGLIGFIAHTVRLIAIELQ